MKGNKLALLLSVASFLTLTTVSCGQKSESKKIRFWHTFGQSIEQEIQSQANKFEKIIKETEGIDVDIDVKYQGNYSDLESKIIKGFTTGDTPTITVAYPDNVANYLSKERKQGDYVVNLEKFIKDPEIGLDKEEQLNPGLKGVEDYLPSYFEEGTKYKYEGVYSLPFMKSTELMLYNKDLVGQILVDMKIQQSADVYMSKITWTQLMEMLDFIGKNADRYGMNGVDTAPLFYDSDANLFITQCFQRGIDYIDINNGKGEVKFVNDEAKKMVGEFKDLYDRKLLLTKGTNKNEYGSDAFKQEKCILMVGSTGGSAYSDSGVSFETGVCKFPAHPSSVGTDREKYVSQGVTLALLNNPADSKDQNDFKTKYGWKFLKYISNTENAIDACLNSAGYIPAKYSCYEDEYYSEYLENTDYMPTCARIIINEIKDNYFNYPVFTGSATARDSVGAIITNVLTGKWGVDEAFENAYNETIKDIL